MQTGDAAKEPAFDGRVDRSAPRFGKPGRARDTALLAGEPPVAVGRPYRALGRHDVDQRRAAGIDQCGDRGGIDARDPGRWRRHDAAIVGDAIAAPRIEARIGRRRRGGDQGDKAEGQVASHRTKALSSRHCLSPSPPRLPPRCRPIRWHRRCGISSPIRRLEPAHASPSIRASRSASRTSPKTSASSRSRSTRGASPT
ncbi:hypothetical protein WR25_23099 [Diploscapter pachys]|uniref:Uncharacterized protein n=1 Tax=Diploscapter pachys TaxID=2018661 RepID=A0A2A2K8H5_9BILA|nr:hypothetical protein WR25_23099 [Diploscapter pachys]